MILETSVTPSIPLQVVFEFVKLGLILLNKLYRTSLNVQFMFHLRPVLWTVLTDWLSLNHVIVLIICNVFKQPVSVAYLAVVRCMFLYVERQNCTSFIHVIADCLNLCIMSYCVCFMKMFSSCLINVLLSLTHFSLAWYFVSLVTWIMSDINTVCECPAVLFHLSVTSVGSTSI